MCKRLVVVEIFLKRKQGTYDARELYDIFCEDKNVDKRIRKTTSFFCFSRCAKISSKMNDTIKYDKEIQGGGRRLVASISLNPCITMNIQPTITAQAIACVEKK